MDKKLQATARLISAAAAVFTSLTIFAFVHSLAEPSAAPAQIAAAAPAVR